jgi:predicted ATPase with chaperone activity
MQPLNVESLTRHAYVPRPRSLEETGLSADFIGSLVLKHLHVNGIADLHQLSENMALSGNILETIIDNLRKQNRIEVLAASFNSKGERFAITDKGTAEALKALAKSGYVGPAPVTIEHYRKVVEAQSVKSCKITQADIRDAFRDTTINPRLLDLLGPALHSGRAIMVYGLPGTGKTYICKRLARLLGSSVFIPYAISVGESVIQVFDPALHRLDKEFSAANNLHLSHGTDPRFIKCQRPVAISGGELTLDMLEIDHDKNTRLSQAPLQLKANNGMYIIDDLGRQRVQPIDLFNRWIVPLEEHHDYLSLDSGKRVQFPFDVILIFSANINPSDLADEAFLRRLGYKINFAPISKEEYKEIWHQYADELDVDCPDRLLDGLFDLYCKESRPLLPCHPRDLLGLISDQCKFLGISAAATEERIQMAWDTYFINLENTRIDS